LDLAEPFLLACAQRGAKSGHPGKTQSAAKAIPSLTIKRGTTVTVTFYNRNTNDDIDVSVRSSLRARRCTSKPYH